MATAHIIEEESGTYHGRREHRHNGYYAGDFSGQPISPLGSTTLLVNRPPRLRAASSA